MLLSSMWSEAPGAVVDGGGVSQLPATDSDYAVLLYAWLAERFGPGQLFWDQEDIDPGKEFRRVLSQHLRGCDALVVLIGPGWSPSECIRREIGAALRRKVLVVPVLVGEAKPLEGAGLPKSIRKLAALQRLGGARFAVSGGYNPESSRLIPPSTRATGRRHARRTRPP